ncbi:MAG TPA: (Fe-S)-binding protein [Candidatus Gastranaerophilaceae bacterium]|nr:(Fe-S)-binding protein [Candidatus Gastranaerophilaceae bacterium]HPT40814.1 (Fe-S)-binding protein [Candidatus Gastranaerophilaceae bacterium]
MKKLIDYKEEIQKCSKCGLCQSVCPVYKVTGNDCAVSRGKFIMLGGIIKGDLKLKKNVNKYLDMCLKCNACKDFCPSGIDAREIFTCAKCEYFEGANSKFVKILNSPPVFNLFLNSAKICTNTYRFLKFDRILKLFYPILLKSNFGKRAVLANEFIAKNSNILTKCTYSPIHLFTHSPKIIYFKGCVNEYLNPSVKNAAENVLKKMGVNVLDIKFQCCGLPFLSVGNAEQFKKQAEFNLAQIPDDFANEFDYFLTDCASCQDAFREYKKVIDDEKLMQKLDKILEKSLNINEFIVKNTQKFVFDKKIKITFHKPCHLENIDFLQEFLSKAENVEYIEMKEFDSCCGFAGAFALNNDKISKEISSKKAKNAIETEADYILTSCPSCVLGLKQGLIENGKLIPVLNFVEFIQVFIKSLH